MTRNSVSTWSICGHAQCSSIGSRFSNFCFDGLTNTVFLVFCETRTHYQNSVFKLMDYIIMF